MNAPAETPRYFALDALRGLMMLLGIVLHAAMFYRASQPPTSPLLLEHDTAPAFDLLFCLIHSFRMPAFFVLSGFLAALVVEQRGIGGFFRQRARRVLLPFLIALVTILPVAGLVFFHVLLSARFGTRSLLIDRQQLTALVDELTAAGFPMREPSVLHLWFLLFLIYFSLLLPVFTWLAGFVPRFAAEFSGRFVTSPGAVAGLGLLAAATLWPFRGGEVFEGVVQLKPQLRTLVYYGTFFFFGVMLHRRREALACFPRRAWWHAAAGVGLLLIARWASETEYAATAVTPAVHLAAVAANGLCTWALIYAAIGFALRYFTAESPLFQYLCRASYWVYLVHLAVIGVVVWLLLPYRVPAVFKFGVVTLVTVAVCFLSYHHLVQRTWIGLLLNGRRFDQPWPWRKPPPP